MAWIGWDVWVPTMPNGETCHEVEGPVMLWRGSTGGVDGVASFTMVYVGHGGDREWKLFGQNGTVTRDPSGPNGLWDYSAAVTLKDLPMNLKIQRVEMDQTSVSTTEHNYLVILTPVGGST